ncbi:hypothetical protein KY366_01570 [Candidatus Woesearchaeota archaeon]|nr:hypothetical protein [Candidatus Woesearchaeota archaeon]
MALFGKKKEAMEDMPPDMGMPPGQPPFPSQDQYGSQGYDQGYGYPDAPEQYPDQYAQGMPPDQQGMAPPPSPQEDRESIEEIAEAIVEEKWKEKEKEIKKIINWKDEVTSKLAQLQQQITDLKGSFDSLHQGMLGKISEYDENLTNVGTEIKAMEKVFSKVLPSLTESVNKLGRMSSASGIGKKR